MLYGGAEMAEEGVLKRWLHFVPVGIWSLAALTILGPKLLALPGYLLDTLDTFSIAASHPDPGWFEIGFYVLVLMCLFTAFYVILSKDYEGPAKVAAIGVLVMLVSQIPMP